MDKGGKRVAGEARGFRLMFRTLSSRNYRLFFTGQGISLTGIWMQRVALSWLVFRLTGSEFLLGIVGFLGLFPTFVIGPFAGVLADRVNRHHALVAIQCVAMLQAVVLALLVLTDRILVWHILGLAAYLGIVNAFETPIRQSFIVEIIEKKEDLGNAIALNSAIFNGARLVGPSVAGVLISGLGEGVCFLLNALSYLGVITGLLLMKLEPREAVSANQNLFRGLAEGFRYAFGSMTIRSILLLVTLVSIAGMPYTILMPVFAKNILHGDAHTLGFLMAANGVGALFAALFLSMRRTAVGLESYIPLMAGVFGLGLAGFALSRSQWLSMVFLAVAGFGMISQMASSNTVLQAIVDDDKRGRVLSFYIVCFMGMAPIGSLLGGAAAARIGAPHTVLIGGLLCLAASLLYLTRLPRYKPVIRNIYREKGLDPQDSPPPPPRDPEA